MAEEVRATDQDIGGGDIPDNQNQLIESQRKDARIRQCSRIAAFVIASGFVTAMSWFFIQFVGRVLCLFEAGKGKDIDWHILLLGSGFIIPSTLILYSLVRWTHTDQKSSKSDDDLPSSGLLKEVTAVLKDVTDMIGSMAKKSGD